MLHFKKKIESVIYSKDSPPVPLLALLLHGISFFYSAAQRLKAICYRFQVLPTRALPCRVISVGNITVGGTGKTPMTLYLAAEIKHAGFNVAIVSRGYKGRAEKQGGVVSDGRTVFMDAEQAGDEPYMIACRLKGVPVVVGKNRFAAGMLAIEKYQPDVIVLDDAFQHIQLKRDIDLVLLDHIRPFGNTHLLPRGVLREPPSALARSAACILTRCRAGTEENALTSLARIQMLVPDIPVFSSSHVPYWYVVQKGKHPSFEAVPEIFSAKDVGPLKLSKVFCFSGIGRNDHFRQTVRDLGFMAAGSLEFLDHHQYTEKDRVTILRCAADAGADRLITTEKDYARIASKAAFPLELIVIGVKVSFGDSTRDFGAFIHNRLSLAMA